jgi:protein involved in polysaccharide export with SLBB domain
LTTDSVIARTYSFALKDGFVIEGEPGFILEPFDEVYVRKSPGYNTQQNVVIQGQVMFSGTYTLSTKNERLSDLVKKAGGVTDLAYIPGARLERVITPEERLRMQTVLRMANTQSGNDSVDVKKLDLGETYFVGIELDKALNNPGGDADLVLRTGDRLIVPEYNGTVKISGDVMFPNTVFYDKNMSFKDYVKQAGGFGHRAKKSKSFIVYQNGTVGLAKSGAKPEPGCEIVVPSKRKRNVNLGQILSIGSTLTSIAAMAAMVINLTK